MAGPVPRTLKKVAAMNESLVFGFDGATVAQAATATLTRRGFSVVRSFDLRSALAAHADCECPHHGTAQCTCQFVVLLIYGDPSTLPPAGVAGPGAAQLVALTMHCRDNRTQVQVVHDATTIPDPRLVEQVMAALVQTALTLQAQAVPPPAEVTTDAA
jgi:hypothetical protein